ncbi:MAG: APC family permease [Thioploca sp.]|nr:APC family permease [Thioploca sp.]
MSDKDKIIILILFSVFLASFFAMFKLGDYPNSSLFQYLFFIAALTMTFTGFLGATGTFSTTGQTLGGGAAIFIAMVLAVVGLKPYFDINNSLNELVLLMKFPPEEKLSPNEAVLRANNQIKEYREEIPTLTKKIFQNKQELTLCESKQDKLSLAIRYWDFPQQQIKPDDDLFGVSAGTVVPKIKEDKYELSTKDLQKEYVYIAPRTDKLDFGPAMLLKYDDNIPELQLFVRKK